MDLETDTLQKVRTETRPRPVSPLNGVPTPMGRRKGIPNKVTRTIREAVEIAAREVTDSQGRKGLAAWMLERASGGIQDRQIFAAMVSKALPLTVAGNVGGVTINLAWLQGREVSPVTVTSQSARKSLIIGGGTRSIDPPFAQGAAEVQAESATAANGDPPPPFDRQEGGGD